MEFYLSTPCVALLLVAVRSCRDNLFLGGKNDANRFLHHLLFYFNCPVLRQEDTVSNRICVSLFDDEDRHGDRSLTKNQLKTVILTGILNVCNFDRHFECV